MADTITAGKLKIFLGYAPMGGKTYAMLDAALRKQADGIHVVIGCLSQHGLSDYTELLKSLGQDVKLPIPSSLDLDALLSLHPAVVVVDELATRNPIGARHPFRYLDVDELLAAGIDVFSTLNIQELESLRDVISDISTKIVHETIPDRVFQVASVIELIDVPPEEIIQRLERKIASGELNQEDFEPYLSEDRLTRLREIALRRAVGSIGRQYRVDESASTRNSVNGGVLVCVSSHPLSEKLIRAGKRKADELHSPWHVLYIETPERARPLVENRERLERSLTLAEKLGAVVHRQASLDISRAIATFVKRNNIATVIVGAPRRTKSGIFARSQVERLVASIEAPEILIIREGRTATRVPKPVTARNLTPWIDYLKALGVVAIVTGISFPLHLVIDPVNLVMFYIVAVMACAFFLGRGPAILASFTGVLAFDYFMVIPRFSLTIADTQYLFTFLGLFVISLVVSSLVGKIRAQVDASHQREELTSALYNLSQELTEAYDREAVIAIILRQIQNTFVRQCTLWLVEVDGVTPYPEGSGDISQMDLRPVNWVVENRRSAGRGTDTYPEFPSSYYPMIAGNQVVGVIEVNKVGSTVLMNLEKRDLLEAYSGIAALAVERTHLVDEQKRAQLVLETERLQNSLLNSISHDLRTPLATISGVLSSLRESELPGSGAKPLSRQTRLELLDSGWDETQRLNRIVGNLLDITRLESGALRLNLNTGDLEGVVGAVLTQLSTRLSDFEVHVKIAPDLPPLFFDQGLIEQVLANILDNAIKFSTRDKKIDINITFIAGDVVTSISDNGKGVTTAELNKIFDKFYRGKGAKGISGSGLGLSICKGIIQAHDGRIWAEANKPHGLTIHFSLPVRKES